MKTGIDLIRSERQRQIEKEGYSIEHDKQYLNNELFMAACCYFGAERSRAITGNQNFISVDWPWAKKWWKPTPNNRIRELEKAGALFMAHNELTNKVEVIDEWVSLCAKDINKLLVNA